MFSTELFSWEEIMSPYQSIGYFLTHSLRPRRLLRRHCSEGWKNRLTFVAVLGCVLSGLFGGIRAIIIIIIIIIGRTKEGRSMRKHGQDLEQGLQKDPASNAGE